MLNAIQKEVCPNGQIPKRILKSRKTALFTKKGGVMKNKILNAAMILLLSLCVTTFSFAQAGRQAGSISGTVADEEGHPLPGAKQGVFCNLMN